MNDSSPRTGIAVMRQTLRSAHWSAIVLPVAAVTMVAWLIVGVTFSHAWPLVHDAPLFHYVVFLMHHGFAPYRDIVEVNMPGTYIADNLAVGVFGSEASGWWAWDCVLGVALIAASAWVSGAGHRCSGIVAGGYTYLSHLTEGPFNLGQRDLLVAVLLVLGTGCLFRTLRGGRAPWCLVYGALWAAAVSIKPPAAIFAVLLPVAWHYVRHHGRSLCDLPLATRDNPGDGAPRKAWWMVVWFTIGAGLVIAYVTVYLVRWGVLRAFLVTASGLIPWYAGVVRATPFELLTRAWVFPLLSAYGLVLFLWHGSRIRWQSVLLLLGACSGIVLFVVQGKGWLYHLYAEKAFVALWAMLEVERAVKTGRSWVRVLGITTVLFVADVSGPPMLIGVKQSTNVYPVSVLYHLVADLDHLGGERLSGQVQCLDHTLGSCINALGRLKIVQSTGFIYDYYLFPKTPSPVTTALQNRFLRAMQTSPPRVLIISSHMWPPDAFGYEEIDTWPAFAHFLAGRYRLSTQYTDPVGAGYRLYTLQGGSQ